jgi:Fe2+ transport system protein FeoA
MIELPVMTTEDLGIPLSLAPAGTPLRLLAIHAGRRLTHRLNELGLTPGVEVTIVHDSGGPLLLAVRDSRVAVGRGMAHKLRVEAL